MLREAESTDRVACKSLVVVNHDPEFLRLFRRVIEGEAYRALGSRYQVVVSAGGDGAWEVICEVLPDAVVLDLPPEDSTSWQLLDRLAHDPRTAAIPVLACSVSAPDVQVREPELRSRGYDLLLKPFSQEAVAQLIADRAARPFAPEPLQRAALLAYFCEQQLGVPEVVRHLEELASERQQERQPAVAAAAQAILADWGERVAVGWRVPCDKA